MSSKIEDLSKKLIDNGSLTETQLNLEITKKLKEYQGFLSKDAIIFLIAKEQGMKIQLPGFNQENNQKNENIVEMDYNELTLTISDVQVNETKIVLLGKIEKIFDVKKFAHKNGTSGRIGSFIIDDGTGKIKVNLWNEQTKIFRNEFFKENLLVRIVNAYSKFNRNTSIELHLGKNGKIVLAPNDVDYSRFPLLKKLLLHDTDENQKIQVKDLLETTGFITFIEGTVSKIESFREKTLDNGSKTFLLKFILSDKSGFIYVVAWNMIAVTLLKQIEEGMRVRMKNIYVKHNKYLNSKEIHFTKKSTLEFI